MTAFKSAVAFDPERLITLKLPEWNLLVPYVNQTQLAGSVEGQTTRQWDLAVL